MWFDDDRYKTYKVNIFEDCIKYFEKEIIQQKDINRVKKLITKLIFKYWKDDEAELFGDADVLQRYLNNNYLNDENNSIDIDVLIYWIKKFKKRTQEHLQNKLPCLKAEIDKYWRYLETYEPKSRANDRLAQAKWDIKKMDRYIKGYWSDPWAYSNGTPDWEYNNSIKEEFAIEEN